MSLESFVDDENAVSIVIGHVLSLVIVMLTVGSIVAVFYLYVDSSSQQSMRIGATDLGSQIARDITNMHIISINSKNISLMVRRDIPLTLGGRGYRINLKNATGNGTASIEITDAGFFGQKADTKLSSINASIDVSGIVYSGHGEMNIIVTKNSTGDTRIWIK